jgi:hypothetical protein
MGLFDMMGQHPAQPQQGQQRPMTDAEMHREVDAIKGNPVGYLRQRGYNIPDGMTDVRQITQYMFQNGMIGVNRLQSIMQRIGAAGR